MKRFALETILGALLVLASVSLTLVYACGISGTCLSLASPSLVR
jgi:hypothetical protein